MAAGSCHGKKLNSFSSKFSFYLVVRSVNSVIILDYPVREEKKNIQNCSMFCNLFNKVFFLLLITLSKRTYYVNLHYIKWIIFNQSLFTEEKKKGEINL